jgi:hypothetical protein
MPRYCYQAINSKKEEEIDSKEEEDWWTLK